jgi:cation:H+ antiporter|tara:strand:- start:23810 stop:24784 length:975 start_codon:yes stop_codon:yes gene_type:complete
MTILIALGMIIFSSIIIYFAGERFAESSSKIGDYFNLPRDVKGATFDAVSSSLPELLVVLYSVIFFKQFEVGIGTIAGSALFNLLVIPGICVFVAPLAFKVSKKVIIRDALFYMIAVFVLIILLIYFKTWGLIIALLLLFIYFLYIKDIISHARVHKKKHRHKKSEEIKLSKEFLTFFLLMLVIGVFTFLLTDSAIDLSHALGVSPIIIAFTIIAAATSVPDTVISVINAKKGDIDDATSNVFGSNIFDILVGIGLPLLIYVLYKGAVIIEFANLEIVLGLLGSTILLLYFFAEDRKLNREQAGILLFMYLIFVVYTVFLAKGL